MSRNSFVRYGYRDLMPEQVKNILMVASPYDCFILEEDGRFSDRLLNQYVQLDLSAPPHIEHVTTGKAALNRLNKKSFDLVLTTPHCSDMSPLTLAAKIIHTHENTPVVMLTYDRSEASTYVDRAESEGISNVFLWTGDPKLLVTIVKTAEDLKNVDHDTRAGHVRVIIVVDDAPGFYSGLLPRIYDELMVQLQSLLPARLNERDRHYRMKTRPKVLLARTYEEAEELFHQYRRYLLGIFCDLVFPREGKLDREAGPDFIRYVRRHQFDLPLLMMSREDEGAVFAEDLGIEYINKDDPDLFRKINRFMKTYFGFGPFIFESAEGVELGRASDLHEMIKVLRDVPADSLRYHAERQHFSIWLMARNEFSLAMEVRPRRVHDFKNIDETRNYLIDLFTQFLKERQKGQITELLSEPSFLNQDFTRIGRGSLGGKGRGIAFLSHLLAGHPIHHTFPDIRIFVPQTVVIGTDEFDRFCSQEGLHDRAASAQSDEELARLFNEFDLETNLREHLATFISQVKYPLAVRSSSLQEDSQFQPLAGLYNTFMLPNCSQSETLRLDQLCRAIKIIYASTFFKDARDYMEANKLHPDQEKMAIIIQELVGRRYNGRFYPNFAGVAQSYNYYPLRHMKPKDGIATVALGLGQTVVEGRKAFRFCPRYPHILPQMSTPDEALRSTQRQFYALDLSHDGYLPELDDEANLLLLNLERAERDGTLAPIGATFSKENNAIYDSAFRRGTRLINFSGVLKHEHFPLSETINQLLEICRRSMGTPVEMEFAVNLAQNGTPAEMALLQIRPLRSRSRQREVRLDVSSSVTPLLSGDALGNGIYKSLRDIVYIHPNRFDITQTRRVGQEIAAINHQLTKKGRPYVLAGPGRWGTADPWLGVPVDWTQVAGARVIVEMALETRQIDMSQGAHFFHNLTALRVGYFSIVPGQRGHQIDLQYLENLPAEYESQGVRHVILPSSFEVRIDGRIGQGIMIPTKRN